MPCEMCGADAPLRRATIEGTVMMVCPSCAKLGVEYVGAGAEVTGKSRVVDSLQRRATRSRERDVYSEMQGELADDYGEGIRRARQKRGLSVEDLARKINEKSTFLSKIEAGQQRPSDELTKKLERELGVKLREAADAAGPSATQPAKRSASGPVTLGDFIREKLDD